MTTNISLIDFNESDINLVLSEWTYGSTNQQKKNQAYLKLFRSSRVNKGLATQLLPFAIGIAEVIQQYHPELSFNLKTLFGEEQWMRWSNHKRRILGKLFATLVRNGLLPIVFYPNPKKGKMRHYLLKTC